MAERIGAVVITRNEEANIARCLRSLQFCDERVVVDSFSTDATVRIACTLAENVYLRDFVHHAEQKNWAARQLQTEWVLVLDADERIPEALATEIRERVARGGFDGWWIFRRNAFFGRFISGAGWDRDRVLRLYRRDKGRYDDRLVHEEVRMDPGARTGRCEGRLLHYSYGDWPSTFDRLLAYSRSGARERARRGQRGSVFNALWRPQARFLKQFVVLAGWRDGLHGFVLCQWAAIGVFLRELRILLGASGDEDVNPGPSRTPRVECVQGRPPIEQAVEE